MLSFSEYFEVLVVQQENKMILPVTLLLLAALVKGNNNIGMLREDESGNSVKDDKDENVAFESFGSPVYGASNAIPYDGLPLNGKSAYNYPATPVSTLPASYPAYIASLGLSNPYAYGAYNKYNTLPYNAPSSFGYGGPSQNGLGYGYSSLYSGYGYGSPYYGRSSYPVDSLGYPGYAAAGLGYRYGGLGYIPAALRGAPVARASVAPFAGVGAQIPRFPATVAGISAPFVAYSASVPSAAYSAPAAIAPASQSLLSPYRSAVRTVQAKDGSLRYTYVPVDSQGLQAY